MSKIDGLGERVKKMKWIGVGTSKIDRLGYQ